MKKRFLESLAVLSLVLSVLARPDLAQTAAVSTTLPLEGLSINLPVNLIKQSKATSCGEAVIAMAYNYAYPQTALNERVVLSYAEMQGYYTETRAPFTSPANMLKIVQHYARNYSNGTVISSAQGLALLRKNLQRGTPVIIDVFARLDDPASGAHFVLVTGISVAPDNRYAIMINYNEPLTGKNKSSPWLGDEGIWNAWRHNGDPGGSGWWLSVPPPAALTPVNSAGSVTIIN